MSCAVRALLENAGNVNRAADDLKSFRRARNETVALCRLLLTCVHNDNCSDSSIVGAVLNLTPAEFNFLRISVDDSVIDLMCYETLD